MKVIWDIVLLVDYIFSMSMVLLQHDQDNISNKTVVIIVILPIEIIIFT